MVGAAKCQDCLVHARQFGVNIYQRAGETVTLELLRNGKKLTLQAAVLERPRDTDQVLALMNRDGRPVPAYQESKLRAEQEAWRLADAAGAFANAVIIVVVVLFLFRKKLPMMSGKKKEPAPPSKKK